MNGLSVLRFYQNDSTDLKYFLFSVSGHYKLPALDKVMESLYQDYGEIVKVGGLIGHPDLLFIFNPNHIERIFKREETLPHRPSMPSVKYYKQVLHKEFFGKNTGIVGV